MKRYTISDRVSFNSETPYMLRYRDVYFALKLQYKELSKSIALTWSTRSGTLFGVAGNLQTPKTSASSVEFMDTLEPKSN